MEIKHFEPSFYSVSIWSGGKTTELLISPENATLAERNFDVRLSTASIEVESSTFTSMNGYLRKLLVLEGTLELNHEDQHSVKLSKFEQDSFSGDWHTTSKGKAIDFNLIYRPELSPEMSVNELNDTQVLHFSNAFIYLLEGNLKVNGAVKEPKSSLFSKGEFEIEAVGFARFVIILFNSVGIQN